MSVFDTSENVVRYEDWFSKNVHVFDSEVNAVKSVIPYGVGFEVGIGTGLFAERLGIRMGNDPSESMLKKAREKGRIVYNCAGDNLPFHDGYFDFTLMVTTICFLDNPKSVLDECYRVTNKNGYIIIAFVDSESTIGKRYRDHAQRSVFYRDAIFYSVDQIVQLLENSNFKVDTVKQTLYGDLSKIDRVQEVKDGSGEGSFVVIRAKKN